MRLTRIRFGGRAPAFAPKLRNCAVLLTFAAYAVSSSLSSCLVFSKGRACCAAAGLLFSLTVQAQTDPATPPALPPAPAAIDLRLPPPPAADEKRDRTEQLFKRRRTGGIIWSAIGALNLSRVLVGAASAPGNAGGVVIGALVGGGIPLGIGLGKFSCFSATREEEALYEYSRSRQFPEYVERRID